MNRLLMLFVFGITILWGGMARSAEVATLGRIERLDPAFDRLVGEDATIELLAANNYRPLVNINREDSLTVGKHQPSFTCSSSCVTTQQIQVKSPPLVDVFGFKRPKQAIYL